MTHPLRLQCSGYRWIPVKYSCFTGLADHVAWKIEHLWVAKEDAVAATLQQPPPSPLYISSHVLWGKLPALVILGTILRDWRGLWEGIFIFQGIWAATEKGPLLSTLAFHLMTPVLSSVFYPSQHHWKRNDNMMA